MNKKTAAQKPVAPPTIPERLLALEEGIKNLDKITVPRLIVGVNDELAKVDRIVGSLRRDLSGIMEVVDTCVGLLGEDTVATELQNRRTRRAMDADTRLQELIIADLEAGKLESEATVRANEGQEPGSLIVTQEFSEGSEDPLPGSYSARFIRDSLPEVAQAFVGKGPGAEALVALKKNGQPLLNEKGEPRQNKVVLLAVYKQKPLPPEGEAAPEVLEPEPTAPAAPEAASVEEPQDEAASSVTETEALVEADAK